MIPLLLACAGPGPEPRYSAVGVVDAAGEALYVAGGATAAGKSREVWRFDLARGRWKALEDAPEAIFRATAVRYGDDVWVFGGTTDDDVTTDHLWRWSLADGTWEAVEADGAPSPRYKHAAVDHQGRMVVHGGRDGDVVHEDLAWFDPEARAWVQTELGSPGAIYRQGLAAVDDTLFVHGGLDADDARREDFWTRAPHGAWSPLPEGPEARASHTLVATDAGLLLWGGHATDTAVWTFDGEAWSTVDAEGPEARDAQVSAVGPDGDAVYVFGGDPFAEGDDLFLGDVWRLEPGAATWTRLWR